MPGPLSGKVALITGGSKGIGRATALKLAADGAKVVINYSSDAKAAEEVVQSIGSENAIAVKADASNLTELEALVKATVDKFGKIDILIPNAGIMPMRTLEETTEEDFDRTMSLNVKGPYFLTQVNFNCPPTPITCTF
jgi:3-oxoacyl-[acyl-carrier protein] reductase